jgi:glycosyltransferase involved in cell wall biosynthesis
LKHDGAQILALAANFGGDPEVVIVVASEGPGAAAIKNGAAKLGLSNVLVLGFQPFDVYQNVLASADILLAMISLDASEYSVPSKVLSYLCAERAIVLCAPRQNLAARIVEFAEAGLVSLPGDQDALAANVRLLLENPERRAAYGERGRAYASATFDIGVIGQRFLSVISAAVRKSDEGKSAASAGASPNTLRQHELS